MCEECRYTVCVSGCPNYSEPPVVCFCSECKEEIHEGDEYLDLGEDKYCMECVKIMTKVAEVDEYWEED